MPSRVKTVLKVDGSVYYGGYPKYILVTNASKVGIPIPTEKNIRKMLCVLANALKGRVWADVKLQFFREQRFQNPQRSEYESLTQAVRARTPRRAPARVPRIQARTVTFQPPPPYMGVGGTATGQAAATIPEPGRLYPPQAQAARWLNFDDVVGEI